MNLTFTEWMEHHYQQREFGIPGGVWSSSKYVSAGVVWFMDSPMWAYVFEASGRVNVISLADN